MTPALGPVEFLILMIAQSLFSGGGLLGTPPAERDPNLLKATPAQAIVYLEWAARSAGKQDGPGIDGFFADPEIRDFLSEWNEAILSDFGEGGGEFDIENPLQSKHSYEILKQLLVRPGAFYLRLDSELMRKAAQNESEQGRLFLSPLEKSIEAGLILNGGDQADDIEANLVAMLNSQQEEGELTKLHRHLLPSTRTGAHFLLHRHRNYLILAIGEKTLDRILERLDGSGTGLAANEQFAAAQKSLAYERTASIAWFDLAGLLDSLKQGLGVQGTVATILAQSVGLDAVQWVASTTGVIDGQVCSRTRVKTDGRTTGILALLSGRPLTPADVAHIPSDADLVLAGAFHLEKVLATVRTTLEKADPALLKSYDDALKQWEQDGGIPIADTAAAFGQAWTIHNPPSHGSVLMLGAVASLELRDRDKAKAIVDRLQALAVQAILSEEAVTDDSPRFVEQEFLGHRISYLVTPHQGWRVAPAVCLTERHLLLALHPQALKAHLRSLKSARPGFDSVWKTWNLPPEGELYRLSYMKTAAWTRLLSGILPYWAKAVEDDFRFRWVQFRLFAIPSAEAIAPYCSDALSTSVRLNDGFLIESRGGLPTPGGVRLLLNLMIWMNEPSEFPEEGF